MCRIAGLIDKNISESVLIQMRDTLTHGGPDDAGIFIDNENNLGLSQRRLSIIDLSSGGHQPMEWKHWVIVYNGEIYNYKEVRDKLKINGYVFTSDSDTEVILKAFEFWGYDCVNEFRGMFAFAIWDRTRKKLLLCRDRVGVKPLYWYFDNQIFLFASELKALMIHPGFKKKINSSSVSLYLQTGYIKSPFSIFESTFKLEPGSFLEVDTNFNIRKWKYWDLRSIYSSSNTLQGDEKKLINECENILTESFFLRMVADVPVGMFLSGGIDSSIVTALLQVNSKRALNTFTIGFDNQKFDESKYANAIARHLNTNHTELICKEKDFEEVIAFLPDMFDEPFGDSSAIPTYIVSKLAKQKVTVSLSADGGDEIFTGYNRYLFANKYSNKLDYFPDLFKNVLGTTLERIPYKYLKTITEISDTTKDLRLDARISKLVEILKSKNIIDFLYASTTSITKEELSKVYGIDEAIFNKEIQLFDDRKFASFCVLDMESYLEGDILAKVDRATMRVALEGREPFLDHKIIEFAIQLPDKFKIRNGKSKWILRQILNRYVPEKLIDRPKMGFGIPLDQWLHTILRDVLVEIMKDKEFYNYFSLDYDYTSNLVRAYINGKYNKPYFIWYIFCLHQWYKRWIL
jgi:asparagine synthase (glutamine-hydrolysing)